MSDHPQVVKFNRSLHEGKDCPECGGIHYGSRFCPYSKEGMADSDEALRVKQALEHSKPPREHTYTDSAIAACLPGKGQMRGKS